MYYTFTVNSNPIAMDSIVIVTLHVATACINISAGQPAGLAGQPACLEAPGAKDAVRAVPTLELEPGCSQER